MPVSQKYDVEEIEVLAGLDPVRKRPGMYTDTARPNHLAQEVVDNSVDEVLAGYAHRIDTILYEDGSCEVVDDGRGMPVAVHPQFGVSGVELILTRLHAGAKFSNRSYRYSGGLHGVGVSVVNALSERLEVTVFRDGAEYHMAFAGGEVRAPLERVGDAPKSKSGTRLRFWPDAKYFDSPKFAAAALGQLLRAKAVLCPNLCMTLDDRASGTQLQWQYDNGLVDYLKDELDGGAVVPADPLVGDTVAEHEQLQWALAWRTEFGEPVTESYVNLIPTIQGGTHVNGFRSGLTEAMREFCELQNLLPRGLKLTPDDVWSGCCYVLSVKMLDPQFSGQTKERLSSRAIAGFVQGAVHDHFSLWLNQNPEAGSGIAAHIIEVANRRAKRARTVVRKKITSGPALPGKLADCVASDPAVTELFLVEGDSAGGSAKQARDRETQAILPLRGKILNTWETDADVALASEEIHNISVAIGVDPGSADVSGLRYGKICVLADADSDGSHIATLISALFLRHYRALVEAGHFYIAMPPLYRVDAGKQTFYALDEAEKQAVLARLQADGVKAKITVTRFKGLGEMNPPQLRETTMAPDTRRLVQLTLDGQPADGVMDMLLARKRAGDRKAWLEENGDRAEV